MSVPQARDGRRQSLLAYAWPPTLVVLIGYAVVTFVMLHTFDYTITGAIRIGDILPADRFWTEQTRVEEGVGYDGQWFFYIANDPLLRAPDPESFLDLPAYRYARILYPTLAWLLALGQPQAIPWSMLAVNLLAALLGTVACVDVLRQLGASRWIAVGYAFTPPMLIGVSAMLAEPTALALVTAGLALALRGRHVLAGVVLALAVLSREPSILIPLGLGGFVLAQRRWRHGAAYLLPLAVPVGWHVWILERLGSLPSSQSPPNFGVPFGGAYYRLGLLLGWHPPMLGEETLPASVIPEVTVILVSMAIVAIGLTKILERRDAFACLLWLQAALALGTGPLVWADLFSYGRVLGLLYFAFGLTLLTAPHRAPNWWAGVHEWTITIPGRTIFLRKSDTPVTPEVGPAFSPMKPSEYST